MVAVMETKTCQCCGQKRNTSISLASIPLDRRRRYIDDVCRVLNESRFGLGRTWECLINLTKEPEKEEAVFYDMTPAGPVPCYSQSPLGRKGYQIVDAMLRKMEEELRLNGCHSSLSPTTVTARGSPGGGDTR